MKKAYISVLFLLVTYPASIFPQTTFYDGFETGNFSKCNNLVGGIISKLKKNSDNYSSFNIYNKNSLSSNNFIHDFDIITIENSSYSLGKKLGYYLNFKNLELNPGDFHISSQVGYVFPIKHSDENVGFFDNGGLEFNINLDIIVTVIDHLTPDGLGFSFSSRNVSTKYSNIITKYNCNSFLFSETLYAPLKPIFYFTLKIGYSSWSGAPPPDILGNSDPNYLSGVSGIIGLGFMPRIYNNLQLLFGIEEDWGDGLLSGTVGLSIKL